VCGTTQTAVSTAVAGTFATLLRANDSGQLSAH